LRKKHQRPRGASKRGQHKPAKPASKGGVPSRWRTAAACGSRKKRCVWARHGVQARQTAGSQQGQKSGAVIAAPDLKAADALHRRMPKRLPQSRFGVTYSVVNLEE